MSLAPVILYRVIDFELKGDERFVYLDTSSVEKINTNTFYIDKKCKRRGIDFTKDFIPAVLQHIIFVEVF